MPERGGHHHVVGDLPREGRDGALRLIDLSAEVGDTTPTSDMVGSVASDTMPETLSCISDVGDGGGRHHHVEGRRRRVGDHRRHAVGRDRGAGLPGRSSRRTGDRRKPAATVPQIDRGQVRRTHERAGSER